MLQFRHTFVLGTPLFVFAHCGRELVRGLGASVVHQFPLVYISPLVGGGEDPGIVMGDVSAT